MTVAEVVHCADSHFRHMIYGLGLYIVDYPEQVLLACVVQGWCAKYVVTLLLNYISYSLKGVRCMSHCMELDDPDIPQHCYEHTCALLDTLDLKALWEEYSIIGDLVVCALFSEFLYRHAEH